MLHAHNSPLGHFTCSGRFLVRTKKWSCNFLFHFIQVSIFISFIYYSYRNRNMILLNIRTLKIHFISNLAKFRPNYHCVSGHPTYTRPCAIQTSWSVCHTCLHLSLALPFLLSRIYVWRRLGWPYVDKILCLRNEEKGRHVCSVWARRWGRCSQSCWSLCPSHGRYPSILNYLILESL